MKRILSVLVFLGFIGLPILALAQVWTHVVWTLYPGTQAMAMGYGNRYHVIYPPGYPLASAAGATYVATWDGQASCVNVTVGAISSINMAYMGWPMAAC